MPCLRLTCYLLGREVILDARAHAHARLPGRSLPNREAQAALSEEAAAAAAAEAEATAAVEAAAIEQAAQKKLARGVADLGSLESQLYESRCSNQGLNAFLKSHVVERDGLAARIAALTKILKETTAAAALDEAAAVELAVAEAEAEAVSTAEAAEVEAELASAQADPATSTPERPLSAFSPPPPDADTDTDDELNEFPSETAGGIDAFSPPPLDELMAETDELIGAAAAEAAEVELTAAITSQVALLEKHAQQVIVAIAGLQPAAVRPGMKARLVSPTGRRVMSPVKAKLHQKRNGLVVGEHQLPRASGSVPLRVRPSGCSVSRRVWLRTNAQLTSHRQPARTRMFLGTRAAIAAEPLPDFDGISSPGPRLNVISPVKARLHVKRQQNRQDVATITSTVAETVMDLAADAFATNASATSPLPESPLPGTPLPPTPLAGTPLPDTPLPATPAEEPVAPTPMRLAVLSHGARGPRLSVMSPVKAKLHAKRAQVALPELPSAAALAPTGVSAVVAVPSPEVDAPLKLKLALRRQAKAREARRDPDSSFA